MTIGDILGCSPLILNKLMGCTLGKTIIYAPPDDDCELSDESNFDGAWTIDNLLPYFPVLRDLVQHAKSSCHCSYCVRRSDEHSSEDPSQFKTSAGCFSSIAMGYVLLLIGHAIADAFGACDVSGNRNASPIFEAIIELFQQMLWFKQVNWNAWFGVASCVYLGCPFKKAESIPRASPDRWKNAFAAIQFGN